MSVPNTVLLNKLYYYSKKNDVKQEVGVTPEHMSRIIRELERDGIIEVTKGWIDVLVPEKLRSA